MGVKQPTVHAERRNSSGFQIVTSPILTFIRLAMNPLLLPSWLVKPCSIAMKIKIQTRPEWHNISQQLA